VRTSGGLGEPFRIEHDRLEIGEVEDRVSAADAPSPATGARRAAERLVRLRVVRGDP
jgi:hypothetical protein